MLDDSTALKHNTDDTTRNKAGGSVDGATVQDHDAGLLPLGYWNISKLALITIIGAMLGLMAAIFWMRQTTPAYTATMIVGPTAQLGLAGMGVRMPASPVIAAQSQGEQHAEESVSDFEHFRRLLTTPAVAAVIAEDERFMQQLLVNRWRQDKQRWQPPDTDHDQRLVNWLRGTADHALTPPPLDLGDRARFTAVYGADGNYLAGWLGDRLAIRRVGESAMYAVSIRHPDRAVALDLLIRLFNQADRMLREEAKRRVDVQIGHLQRQMARTDLASHRQGMTDLLARELQTSLMLGVDLPFSADMIEPPYAPTVADWPAPLPIAGISMLAGGALAFALGFGWIDRRRRALS